MKLTKLTLIAAELSCIILAISLIWAICLGEVEGDIIKAFYITVFVIASIMLQSCQQEIKWE